MPGLEGILLRLSNPMRSFGAGVARGLRKPFAAARTGHKKNKEMRMEACQRKIIVKINYKKTAIINPITPYITL
jgi:hypothetical protein